MYIELILMALAQAVEQFFFRHIARNGYFAGLDVELLERAGLLREVLWKSDRDKTYNIYQMCAVNS